MYIPWELASITSAVQQRRVDLVVLYDNPTSNTTRLISHNLQSERNRSFGWVPAKATSRLKNRYDLLRFCVSQNEFKQNWDCLQKLSTEIIFETVFIELFITVVIIKLHFHGSLGNCIKPDFLAVKNIYLIYPDIQYFFANSTNYSDR